MYGYIPAWIYVPIIYLAWVGILLMAKMIGFGYMKKMVQRTRTSADDILLKAADLPLTLLIVASGGVVAGKIIPAFASTEMVHYFVLAFKAVSIIAVIVFLDRLIGGLIRSYTPKMEILRTSGGFAQGAVRIATIGIGGLVLLDSFGVSITPIIASLGIGSLAVALALQPTLENFFAGIQIVIDKPIQVGQFVKLESGEEGYIHKIGWRSTWIRFLSNNMVILPNKMLTNSRIINYYYPGTDLAVLVEIGVHYQSDLNHVEKVTIDVAKNVMKEVPGGVVDFEPFIRFHTFGNSSINFTVILRAKEFVDQYLVKHEFVKQLKERYAQEGIVIPYPIYAVNYQQEKSFEPEDKKR
ncbi:MAG: mechanosensitive ion channel family protein [Candidatus Omnitrophota bacterium]